MGRTVHSRLSAMIHTNTKLDLYKALGAHDDLQCMGGRLGARRGCLKVKLELAGGSSRQPTRNKEKEPSLDT